MDERDRLAEAERANRDEERAIHLIEKAKALDEKSSAEEAEAEHPGKA